MRRPMALLLVGLTATTLLTAGCGDDRDDCMRSYKEQQRRLTGITPTDAQARNACGRDSSRGYYGSGGSRVRGGGSGVGK
ncbi:hypothetical protein PZ938_11620 [Luteipulveratus sp. YIM 133132]|uniref:Lipoprotein n=1 Tax=Luteipulveratus flavus TaxID=3031728 RepID=A0ABT6C8Z3_9MICO|nr:MULTISPECIES: hypothetical protein [unclassified Luteipulveratus]MDE9366254.1 hypothetical protein [Luteipulveratus sp. YIM 133132]MDF8265343.1 hypothetical protein [Luteipulveratus sp. YIM 133296]